MQNLSNETLLHIINWLVSLCLFLLVGCGGFIVYIFTLQYCVFLFCSKHKFPTDKKLNIQAFSNMLDLKYLKNIYNNEMGGLYEQFNNK